MTKWEKLKHYINEREIGDTINRKHLVWTIEKRSCDYIPSTLNGYRQLLCNIGILEQVGFGKYKVLAHIKKHITISQVSKAAKPNHWRNWFNDFKETA